VQQQRKLQEAGVVRDLLEMSEVSDVSPIRRSNSEIYLKNIDMQDESDNLFIEINPIIYA
jgi:hypothetical protein